VFAGERHTNFDRGKFMQLTVTQAPAVQRPGGAGGNIPVRRTHAELFVSPTSGATPQHRLGIYEVRIEGPRGTRIYAKCEQNGPQMGFRFASRYRDAATTLPPRQTIDGVPNVLPIEQTTVSTVFDSGARNIITVAAYDDTGHPAAPPYVPASARYAVVYFSSRGPLRDFSGAGLGPLARKPDLAAPGAEITAALSNDMRTRLISIPTLARLGGLDRFVAFDGTSQAAPVVAGIVALMLEKNHNLSVVEVRNALIAGAATRPATNPPAGDPLAHGAYGAGMAHALESHTQTPP
jgi:subtilisin family serine protease